jgi:4,5-DOPA dioxygenase extradiol
VPLLRLGRRLAPLREEGVLIVGSGFLTHGLPYLRSFAATQPPPAWSREFDAWAGEALDRGDLEELLAVHERAPALRYAHPRLEHLAPLYLILGAATDPQQPVRTRIDGFWTGLAKRSFEVA